MRITGTGLAGATEVRFGNAPSKHSPSETTESPDGGRARGAAGTVQITVVTPSGTVSTSGKIGFTYRAHA